jgi:hypothetical protein
MTPKEKARELIIKMYGCRPEDLEMVIIEHSNELLIAKDNALITVEEVMKAPNDTNDYAELIPTDAEDTSWFWDKFEDYWNDVKQEIENL